jgi:hypothetical protein
LRRCRIGRTHSSSTARSKRRGTSSCTSSCCRT